MDGEEAISPAVITLLTTPAAKIPGSTGEYGYGVNISSQRGVRVIQHGGSRSGYGSMITMVPEKQFGAVVLANRSGASLPRTMQKAMDLVLALPETPREPVPPVTKITEQEMRPYVGVYTQGARKMEIVKRDAKLFLKQGTRETELVRVGPHRFTSNLFFVTAADGTVEYLHSGGRSWKKSS